MIARLSSSWRKTIRATGAGGSSMSRSSTRPTSRASPRPGSSPRCSRPTRPATGLMAEKRLGPAAAGGRLCVADDRASRARGSPSGRTSRSKSPNPFPGLAAAVSRQDIARPAAGRLAAGGAGDASSQALARLHPRRGLCRVRRGQDRQPRARANGPTSSSSTATSDRGRSAGAGPDAGARRPGSPGKKVLASAPASAGAERGH